MNWEVAVISFTSPRCAPTTVIGLRKNTQYFWETSGIHGDNSSTSYLHSAPPIRKQLCILTAYINPVSSDGRWVNETGSFTMVGVAHVEGKLSPSASRSVGHELPISVSSV